MAKKVGRPPKHIPQETEVKDGKMFFNGEWIDLRAPVEEETPTERNIPVILTIAGKKLTGTAIPKIYPKGSSGYNFMLDRNQQFWGGGNVYIVGSRPPKPKE